MRKIVIEMDADYLKKLVMADFQKQLGDVPLNPDNIKVEVKSKQNFKSEWEQACFRATYTDSI